MDDHDAVPEQRTAVSNVLSGAAETAVQAGVIHGGVHVHAATRLRPIPDQLPADLRHFIGRDAALAEISALADAAARAGAVVISAVEGAAGVGKTALAVHWAHWRRADFPDGVLYVNLRGFDDAVEPMRPGEALVGFLDALDVPAGQLPSGLDAQAALYRSIVAARRMLVLLDNARDSEQVRPLLPGRSASLVIVTSRNQLDGLVIRDGAQRMAVGVFSGAESRALLASHLGVRRLENEPAAADELVTTSCGLPLALSIVAGRVAATPHLGLGELVSDLRDGLDLFASGDIGADLRTVFSWSYRRLSAPAARLLRLLGSWPGPTISLPAASALAGLPRNETRTLLDELTRLHLLSEHSPRRFQFHDLVRSYARERGLAEDGPPDAATARRVLDHYLAAAQAAAEHLYQHRPAYTPAPVDADVEPVPDYAGAMAWYDAERANVITAVDYAAEHGWDEHAWRLAWVLSGFFRIRSHWADQAATQRVALAAAERAGAHDAAARALTTLAVATTRTGDHDAAIAMAQRAVAVVEDPDGRADALDVIGWAHGLAGRCERAIEFRTRSVALYEQMGNRVGQAIGLNGLGWACIELGRHAEAVPHSERALALHRATGNTDGEARTLDTIGYAYAGMGRFDEALDHYRQALSAHEATGNRYYEAETHDHIAQTLDRTGQQEQAVEHWQAAFDILSAIGHPDAAALRDRLA